VGISRPELSKSICLLRSLCGGAGCEVQCATGCLWFAACFASQEQVQQVTREVVRTVDVPLTQEVVVEKVLEGGR